MKIAKVNNWLVENFVAINNNLITTFQSYFLKQVTGKILPLDKPKTNKDQFSGT